MAAKIFQNENDLELGRKLTEGCLWGYENMPLGIMPEVMHTVQCQDETNCPWDEQQWHAKVHEAIEGDESAEEKIRLYRLSPGVTRVDDARYILR